MSAQEPAPAAHNAARMSRAQDETGWSFYRDVKLHQLASPFVVSMAVGAVGALTSCAAYSGELQHNGTTIRGPDAPLPFRPDSRGVFSLVGVRSSGAVPARVPNEVEERAIVGKNGPATLVDLGGDSSRGTTVTIHGIDSSPETVGVLSDAALRRGEHTLSLAYDDNWRRLQASADDFANLIAEASASMPAGTVLTIEAHSMGARTVVVALDRLARRGAIKERQVLLHLIAPPLSGLPAANLAWLSLPVMETFISNAAPGKDMGTLSAFQRELDATSLGENVRVRVTVGTRDTIVALDEAFRQRVMRLGGILDVVPDLDHTGVLAHVAAQTPDVPAVHSPTDAVPSEDTPGSAR